MIMEEHSNSNLHDDVLPFRVNHHHDDRTTTTECERGGGGGGDNYSRGRGRGNGMEENAADYFLAPPEDCRLLTIVAHVDHGKTTLADHLIAAGTSPLISDRLAGTLRYLDFDPEEQRRGITMRTSGILVSHTFTTTTSSTPTSVVGSKPSSPQQRPPKQQQPPLMNRRSSSSSSNRRLSMHIADSPGHSDFGLEVSTSLLVTDIALIVIDVVEGMGARTHQIVRETLIHARLIPILVLNKIDKLCVDLHLTCVEAYVRLRELLENVNASVAAMINATSNCSNNSNSDVGVSSGDESGKVSTTTASHHQVHRSGLHDTDPSGNRNQKEKNEECLNNLLLSSNDDRNDDNHVNGVNDEERLERAWVFDPAKNNVVFASAWFGMGFTVPALCKSLYQSQAVAIKPRPLSRYCFGDYKLSADRTKVYKWKQLEQQEDAADPSSLPIFAAYALEPLWKIWQSNFSTSGRVIISDGNRNENGDGGRTDALSYLESIVQAVQFGSTAPKPLIREQQPQQHRCPLLPTTTAELLQQMTQSGVAKSGDARVRFILQRYRPLALAVFDSVAMCGPSPRHAAQIYRKRLFQLATSVVTPANSVIDVPSSSSSCSTNEDHIRREIQSAIYACDCNHPIMVAQVCKFVASDTSQLQGGGGGGIAATTKKGTVLLALTRVLSGTLETGYEYFIYTAADQPLCSISSEGGDASLSLSSPQPRQSIKRQAIRRLYLLLGSSFVRVQKVPAGHICAILGLDEVLSQSPATLCSEEHGAPIWMPPQRHQPLVKVSIEPIHTHDIPKLEHALRKLQLADAGVEVSTTTGNGSMLLACSGELHLEQSLVDLQTKFLAQSIELRVSDPLVEFGETTDWMEKETELFDVFLDEHHPSLPPLARQSLIPPYNEEEGLSFARHGRCRSFLTGRGAAIRIRVLPLSPSVHRAIKEGIVVRDGGCEDDLLQLGRALKVNKSVSTNAQAILDILIEHTLICSKGDGCAMVETPALRTGVCICGVATTAYDSNRCEGGSTTHASSIMGKTEESTTINEPSDLEALDIHLRNRIALQGFQSGVSTTNDSVRSSVDEIAQTIWIEEMRVSTIAGFQLAMRSGPICEESIRNVLVVLEGIEIAVVTDTTSADHHDHHHHHRPTTKPLSSGMVVSAMRSGIRCALLTRPVRLMEGILRLTLHSTLARLGALYSILSKRRGKVVEDSMVDGTDLLLIEALVPQAEAFGLAPEVFGKTSGEVTAPEMIFSHWERLEVDPFWIPTSLDEREDFGELSNTTTTGHYSSTKLDNNIALKYIRNIRQRKGLIVDSSRIVVAAEKQRTLKR